MTQHKNIAQWRWLAFGLVFVWVAGSASAQDAPPTAAPEPEAEPMTEAPVEPAAEAPTPAGGGEVAAEVAALRAEVEELKAKQEEAETAALLAETAEAPIEAEKLRIYGFMDFGLDRVFAPQGSSIGLVKPTTETTFVFGNLNLYVDAAPIENLRCLVELRLTVAPNGEELSITGGYVRTDTTAFDFASPSSQSQIRLSGVFIERAWSQYEFSKALRLQWGMFLTPFGIWNLDHGSPTLISLMLPTFIASQMMPTRLLGMHAYGSQFFGNSELGYALHISNGRGLLDYDYTDDKALGGRLFWAYESDFGRLVLGASGYWGTYLDKQRELAPVNGRIGIAATTLVEYTEQVLALDAALDIGGLRVRTESVLRWVEYEPGRAEQGVSAAGGREFLPNRTEWSGYVLAAYRTPWRLEPYVQAESMVNKSAILPRWAGSMAFSTPNVATIALSVGLNIELTTHTMLKTQLAWTRAYDRHFENRSLEAGNLFVRLVDSF